MNNQSGLLTQKPETPVPMVGKLYRFEIISATGKSGKPYTKLKNAIEGQGTECEVLSVEKTRFTDSYGNVSYSVGYEVCQNGQGTREDARRTAPNVGSGARQPDDRSNRIERQHSQEMALRHIAITAHKMGKDFAMPSTDDLSELISWYQRDIGHSPEKPAPQPEQYAPDDSEEIPIDDGDPF